ncbi:MAG: enoyl-CoA hydratase-related protein, partial [Phycisphaerales bacterium]|nr:enoyl-CoA hydratase-related protein [Phycisphaerales bacterium]
CAILSACDFVFVAADATLGYPVHRIGVSPAVTIPTLHQAIGFGAARSLLMGGQLITGADAHRLGLATHLAANASAARAAAASHCQALSHKGTNALRVTKAWLNELDGSLSDAGFDRPAIASAAIATDDEARALLAKWSDQARKPAQSR